MKQLTYIPIMLIILCFSVGCSQEASKASYQLDVTVTYWTDMMGYESPIENCSFIVQQGDSIMIPSNDSLHELNLTITETSEYSITINADEALVIDNRNGIIDIGNYHTTFEINQEEPLCLITPSMDGGTKYVFELCPESK